MTGKRMDFHVTLYFGEVKSVGTDNESKRTGSEVICFAYFRPKIGRHPAGSNERIERHG
jgi:hypothetical protein